MKIYLIQKHFFLHKFTVDNYKNSKFTVDNYKNSQTLMAGV